MKIRFQLLSMLSSRSLTSPQGIYHHDYRHHHHLHHDYHHHHYIIFIIIIIIIITSSSASESSSFLLSSSLHHFYHHHYNNYYPHHHWKPTRTLLKHFVSNYKSYFIYNPPIYDAYSLTSLQIRSRLGTLQVCPLIVKMLRIHGKR